MLLLVAHGLGAYFHSLGGNPSRRLSPSLAFVVHEIPVPCSQSGTPNRPLEHPEEQCSRW